MNHNTIGKPKMVANPVMGKTSDFKNLLQLIGSIEQSNRKPVNQNQPKEIIMSIHTDLIEEKSENSETNENTAIVALYNTHAEAEEAVRELQRSGYDMRKLSIVGKDYQKEEEVVGYYTTGDRMKSWGATGAFWGGLWSLMLGSGFFLIPGIGPLLAAGPIVGWIIGALEGAAVIGGLSALGAGLFSIGIPKDSIIEYETEIKAGKYVVIAHGSVEEVAKTKDTLAVTQHQGIKEHNCCG